ncbi:hypothetical protein [Rathayibacter soli]|uniref:hypothetical protein n=1 Tax=Rathayibacter soli TaxID=3144168 RepID=UPI0027E4AE00|nr:hypothetical protein [Glaciibacter superstes]
MLEPSSAITAGAVLLTVIGVAYGGTFMLRVVTGKQGANALQKNFFRAGHAHAGVLIILGLLVTLFVDAAGAGVWGRVAADGVLACAILIPGGFFFSAMGRDPQKPNRFFVLIWIGFGVLTAALLTAGIALIVAGASALG